MNIFDVNLATTLQFLQYTRKYQNLSEVISEFVVKQIMTSKTMETIRNLTETERKVIANDTDSVVDMTGIDKEKQIPKNCDLKTEIEIKKHNQQREQLL